MDATFRGISGSESDIYAEVLGRVSSREKSCGQGGSGDCRFVYTPAKFEPLPRPSFTVLSLFSAQSQNEVYHSNYCSGFGCSGSRGLDLHCKRNAGLEWTFRPELYIHIFAR